MGAVHPAPAIVQRRDEDLRHAQRFDPNAGTDDIRNRIERADLVESDFLRRLPMNLPLSDGDPLKNRDGVQLDEIREIALLDQAPDL